MRRPAERGSPGSGRGPRRSCLSAGAGRVGATEKWEAAGAPTRRIYHQARDTCMHASAARATCTNAVDAGLARSYAHGRRFDCGATVDLPTEAASPLSASEVAFLAFGVFLGVGGGFALLVYMRRRPRRARLVKVTVVPNAIPARRSVTLSED